MRTLLLLLLVACHSSSRSYALLDLRASTLEEQAEAEVQGKLYAEAGFPVPPRPIWIHYVGPIDPNISRPGCSTRREGQRIICTLDAWNCGPHEFLHAYFLYGGHPTGDLDHQNWLWNHTLLWPPGSRVPLHIHLN